MRAGLVGDDVRLHATTHQFGKNIGGIAEQADRDRFPALRRLRHDRERLIERAGLPVEITGPQPHLDAARLALDRKHRRAGHRRGQRLGAAHAAEPRRQDPLAREAAAVMTPAHLDKRFIGPLHDALAADVDPRSGRHLAEHHQPLPVQFVEVIERRPVRHQVRIRDQHARRIGMGAENADRLARLHHQRLVAPRACAARPRCGQNCPSRGRRGRCRHRRRVRSAVRQHQDRDCSSAFARALPSTSSWR